MVPETNMPVRFYLSPNREDGSASILVSEPLDYETTPFFSLRVRAQNVAAVPLAAFTTVYVNITGMTSPFICLFFHRVLKSIGGTYYYFQLSLAFFNITIKYNCVNFQFYHINKYVYD